MEEFKFHPIGVIRTPFIDRADAPRQPRADGPQGEGVIELLPERNFDQALEDLEGFEFIWIVSWFHKNKNWKPKVLPPRGSKIKRGVFATRSPHRPNPIGLSIARLLGIEGRIIRVAETDLLDGTPILDIKPYLPYAEAHPHAAAGWLDEQPLDEARYALVWSALAHEQAAWLKDNFSIELVAGTERVLAVDPLPHPYRRISKTKSCTLRLALKSWRVDFKVHDSSVEIERVVSGYSTKALTISVKPLHDEAAHRAFHLKWPAPI